MPTGRGSVPWPVIVVIIVLAFIALTSFQGLIVVGLLGGIGAWLIYTAIKGLRPTEPVTYWRGERIQMRRPITSELLWRSIASIVVGLAFLGFAVWYLLFR